jgi:hypothetical protein
MKTLPLIGISALAVVGAACISQSEASKKAAEITKSFAPFAPGVKTHSDDTKFYIESDGMPDHDLMAGIVAWQQQVALPQKYTGSNAWSFPLFPKPAANPLSAKTGFFRGAIAIAANGVPIFNPIKNDGRTDTLIAGELDNFGGHSGRGDDYHYHIAPLHLQSKLGKDLPVAYALDGYAIYGYNCTKGVTPTDLDQFNGHTTKDRGYHYHATKTYPYLNGGFHGEVVEAGGQVDPQPFAQPVRPALPPLRGAKVTTYKKLGEKSWSIGYELNGQTHYVNYAIQTDGNYRFEFVSPDGSKVVETYRPGQRRPGGGPGGPGGGPGGPGGPGGQGRGGQGGGRRGGGGGGDERGFFSDHSAMLDLNADHDITLQEVDQKVRSMFATNGNLTGGFKSFAGAHTSDFDFNGNGAIDRDEALDGFTAALHRADTNHDHCLSEFEWKR